MDLKDSDIIKMNMTYHFQKTIQGWAMLPWWNVKNDMVNIELSIHHLNKLIKNAKTPSKQEKLRELNISLCRNWRERGFVHPEGRGFPR